MVPPPSRPVPRSPSPQRTRWRSRPPDRPFPRPASRASRRDPPTRTEELDVAGPSKRSHPVRSLLALLALTVALFGLVAGTAALKEGGSWTPKLGLDLEGGTQIVLEPVLQSG